MTEHGDRLREAFTKHENQTPDPAAVYARVEELARKYTWRRRGAQAAGGVALSAGLIAGVTQLPAILPADPAAQTAPAFQAAAPAVSPSLAPTLDPSATLTEDEVKEGLEAFFSAGYGYDNARQLAGLWNLSTDKISHVKAVAGKKLLAGETLPVNPVANPDAPEVPEDPEVTKRVEKFFEAGYGWDEAEKLAKMWKIADPSDAKAEAGKRLLAGETLPVKPDPKRLEEAKRSKLAGVFWDAGYDGDDAQKLADLWNLDDSYEAKVEAGRRIQAGETLPIRP